MIADDQNADVCAIAPRERALWLAFRQALLMIVDAIEVYIGMEVRTAELRKRQR